MERTISFDFSPEQLASACAMKGTLGARSGKEEETKKTSFKSRASCFAFPRKSRFSNEKLHQPILLQHRSQALSPFPPLSSRRETTREEKEIACSYEKKVSPESALTRSDSALTYAVTGMAMNPISCREKITTCKHKKM